MEQPMQLQRTVDLDKLPKKHCLLFSKKKNKQSKQLTLVNKVKLVGRPTLLSPWFEPLTGIYRRLRFQANVVADFDLEPGGETWIDMTPRVRFYFG